MVKVQPVPLVAKKVEERPLLVDMTKEVKKDASRRRQQMLKEGEEKENMVGRKEEQESHSWRRSVTVAPRK